MTDHPNPRCRLAPRTSSQQCLPNTRNRSISTADRTSNSRIPDRSFQRSSLSITAADLPNLQTCSFNLETAFNIHNPHPHHRDPGACGFLLVS